MYLRVGIIVSLFVFPLLPTTAFAQATRWKTHRIPEKAIDHLNALNGAGIAEFIFNSSGGYVIVTQDHRSLERNVADVVAENVKQITNNREKIRTIAFTPDSGGWCIVSDKRLRWGGDLPQGFVEKLKEFHDKGESVITVAFAPDRGWIIFADREWWEAGLPQKTVEDIREFSKNGIPNLIAFTPDGGYAVTSGKRYMARNIPDACFVEIERNSVDGFANDSIIFGRDGLWAIVAHKE